MFKTYGTSAFGGKITPITEQPVQQKQAIAPAAGGSGSAGGMAAASGTGGAGQGATSAAKAGAASTGSSAPASGSTATAQTAVAPAAAANAPGTDPKAANAIVVAEGKQGSSCCTIF